METALYRAPFTGGAPLRFPVAYGATVWELVQQAALPHDFNEFGTVTIAGHIIERGMWHLVRPKPGRQIIFHYMPLQGGGRRGGGMKAVLGIVLAVATILTAGAAVGGAFAGLLGNGFAAGTLGAKVLGAGISVVGSLAASALSAPPTASGAPGGPGNPQDRGPASISGNVLRPGMAIPRVIGTRQIYPPLACQPLVERIGLDEYAEGVCVLAGPHKLEDIKVGDTLAEEAEDVTVEVLEGWPDDAAISQVVRYGVTQDLRLELSNHTVLSTDFISLANQQTPAASLPKFHSFTMSKNADEIWGHLSFPGGLMASNDVDKYIQIAFRLRIREVGAGTWINLPEIHFASKNSVDQKPHFKIVWGDPPPFSTVADRFAWIAAYKFVAGQTGDITTADWTAHSMFSAGAGSDALYIGVEDTTNVRRVDISQGNLATFYIDPTIAPKGEYQIEIKKSFPFARNDFTRSNHELNGFGYDLFHYYDGGVNMRIRTSQEYNVGRCFLQRMASVFKAHPIAGGEAGSGLAIITLKVLNREIPNISVKASGYVKDWDGSGWNSWVYGGQYMAAHYRDVLVGVMSPDPVDEDIIDEQSLLDWRTECVAKGYTCNLICEGAGVDEVLSKVASCGYARPGYSEVWGVIMDYDRSAEDPIQIFTSRNSAELRMTKAFPRSPDALRVNYKKADDLDQQREIIVFRPGSDPDVNPRIEVVEYEGLTDEAAVTRRAEYDLLQMDYRSDMWAIRAPVEAVMCRRGDLIGINHDVLDKTHAGARIDDVLVSGTDIVGVVLDSEVPVYKSDLWEDIAVFEAETDWTLMGVNSVISIRQHDGIEVQRGITGASGNRSTIMFDTPIPEADDPDDGLPLIRERALVKIGEAGNLNMRMVVFSVAYDYNFFASITMVPEAPELFAGA